MKEPPSIIKRLAIHDLEGFIGIREGSIAVLSPGGLLVRVFVALEEIELIDDVVVRQQEE